MSHVITKGYLINRMEYNVFDEIITIINEHNLKFNIYCAGTKKISSKNARNLDYGNYIEFEFFYSSNNLSKLKKALIINEMNIENKIKPSLALLNEYFYKNDFKKAFSFYQKCILYMNMNLNDYILMLYMLVHFFKINGLNISFNTCNDCGIINDWLNINFDTCFSYCDNCFKAKYKLTKKTYKLLCEFFNNDDIDLININDINIDEIKKVLKMLNYCLNTHTGIFLDTIKNYL